MGGSTDGGSGAMDTDPDLSATLQRALGPAFELVHELGGGGMSRVFVAQETALGRRVVVKVLAPEWVQGVSADRFAREVRIAAGLQHPHIVPLLAAGGGEGLLYYTMPYVEGESLADRLRREGPLSVGEAVRVAREVAGALQYAHEHGVIHRDVKPANILLSSGHASVTDFGIARALGGAASALTMTGLSVGTPTYMSPEQAAGEPADARSDVYSLGCALYEMLAGEPPFTGPSAHAVIAKRLVTPPPRVSVVRPTVPAALETVLLTALATSPADRYVSAAAMAAALDEAGRETAAVTSPVGSPNRRRALAAAGLVALAAVAALVATRRGDSPPVSATRLAVLPFSVHGGGTFSVSLAHGMVDLLSRNLDGLQRIRTVDPSAVLTRVRRSGVGEATDEMRGREIARQLGAGMYVLGGVNVVSGRLRISAALYEASDGDAAGAATPPLAAVARASVEGDTTQLFALVDRLAADLVAQRYRGPGGRLVETAAATTHSLPALRSYLDAEEHLRNARFDSAAAGFQRAVAVDSTFALAHYRLSIALDLNGSFAAAAVAAERAIAFAGRLGARERRLVEAYGAFVRGAGDDAERAYRSVLLEYPDDLEAQFLLGRTLLFLNPARGRSIAEARPVFDAVLAADPEFLCAICHMIDLAGNEHDWVAYDSLSRRWARASPDRPEVPFWTRAVVAAGRRDTAALRSVTADARTTVDRYIVYVGWAMTAYAEHPAAARTVVEALLTAKRTTEQQQGLRSSLATADVAAGRWNSASREFARAEEEAMRGGRPDLSEQVRWVRAASAALPTLGASAADVESVRAEIARSDPSVPLPGAAPVPVLAVRPHVRLYLLSLLSARLGAHDEALRHIAALERMPVPAGATDVVDAFVRTGRANVAAERGDPERVLATLGLTGRGFPLAYTKAVGFTDVYARWLRAEALRALDRDEEALRWYGVVPETEAADGVGTTLEVALLAPTLLRRAELLERRGDRATARELHARFTALWANADAPVSEAVRRRTGRAARLSGAP